MSHTLLASKRLSRTAIRPPRPIVETAPTLTPERFQECLPKYLPRMLAVARRHLSCEADCADAVQDACVRALSGLPRFRGDCDLGTWLHRIVVNACLMRRRSQAVRKIGTLASGEDVAEQAPDQPKWSESARQIVRSAARELPNTQGLVIQLRYFEGLNTAQTAALLGVRPEVVKTRLHRARRALRRRIAGVIASEA